MKDRKIPPPLNHLFSKAVKNLFKGFTLIPYFLGLAFNKIVGKRIVHVRELLIISQASAQGKINLIFGVKAQIGPE